MTLPPRTIDLDDSPAPDRGRLRFTGFRFQRSQAGQCSAEVQLTWTDGRTVTGRAGGQSSPLGDYRIAAEAALNAIGGFTAGAIRFDLIGVKAIKAFDANLVVVSILAHRSDGVAKLLGCVLAEPDPIKGAALSVLNATNRLIGNTVATR
ncbi:MAG: hypothetical protein HYX65_04050 [Gemmatimonadetes bacterium]|nr:hypothetical protein [Gemmatimonadota bacterium]